MKNGWRIVLTIVLIAIIFGGVCLGVGMMTGADMSRVYAGLDKQFNLTEWYKWSLESIARIKDAVMTIQ